MSTPSSRPRSTVIVVGGGPTGLTAALLAARAGHAVHLVEASPRLGGMAGSPTIAGQRVDLGSHRLHPSASGPTRALLHELLGEDLQTRVRRGRMRLDGRWVRFPLEPADLVRSLRPSMAARIGLDLLAGGRRAESPADDSYADVVHARLGRTVLAHFHGPYAHKLYGVPAEELAGELARRRIALTGVGDVVERLRRTRTEDGRTFLYPRLGYGQIVERLAQAAAAAGAELSTGVTPTAVIPGATPTIRLDTGQAMTADRILWTAPPGSLLAAAGRPMDLTPQVSLRAVVLAYLVVPRDRYLPWDAHYIADPDVPFVRLSEPKNYRDGPDPPGQTVLCAELPCSVGDTLWTADDTRIGRIVRDGMVRLGLPVLPVVPTHTIRLPQVYPRYDNAGAALLVRMRDRASSLDGITVLGRQGLVVADNLHHVMDMAHAAVECLGPDGWDEDAWTLAEARFDQHVIED